MTGRGRMNAIYAAVAGLALVLAGCRESAVTEDVEVTGVWERTRPNPAEYADTIPYSMELHSPGYNGGLKSVRGTFNGAIEIRVGYVQGKKLMLSMANEGRSVSQLDLVVDGGEAAGTAHVFSNGHGDTKQVRVTYTLVRALQNPDVVVAGRWSGERNYTGTGGYDPSPISLDLQQTGDRLEGTFTMEDGDDEGGTEAVVGTVSGVAKGTSVVLTLVTSKGESANLDLTFDGEALVGLLSKPGSGEGWPTRLTR